MIAFERKVQVWKGNVEAPVSSAVMERKPVVDCTPVLPAYDSGRDYKSKANLSNNERQSKKDKGSSPFQ